MLKKTYILPLLFAAMAVSCTDELYESNGTIDNGKRSKMTLEFNTQVLQPGLRTRADENDVKSLWVGVYDITTGNRIGYNPKEGSEIPNTVQVVYYDAHPTVVVVGVANYVGVTNNKDESLQDLLNAAETWADLRNIDIKVSTIDNENSPLMMGYVGATSNNPTIGLGDDNSIYIDGKTAANSNYQVKLIDKNVDDSDFFQQEIKRIGEIQLVPLISTINVEVVEGSGIEVSEIKFKFGNVPEGVYLAERPSYTGDGKNYNNFVPQTPNYADTQMAKSGVITKRPAYFNWENWKNADGKSFNYSHYENKHRAYYYNSTDGRFTGIDNSSVYQKREASWGKGNGDLMQDDEMLKALCNDNQNEYNNFASYFVVNMKVVDHNTGSSGVVSYVVHEGNCNDVNGKALSDPQDYSCFRNMNYNYTLKINGLKSIEVNVDREDGMHNDGISGNLNSVIEDDPEALIFKESLSKEGWQFRFYVSPAANNGVALDYVTNESLRTLDGFYWPGMANYNSDISAIADFITISQDGKPFKLDEFVNNFDYNTTYTVEFKDQSDLGTVDNPQDYMIAMYCYHPDDIETDADGCTTLKKMHRYAGFPKSIVKEKLGTPATLPNYTAYDFITPSIEVSVAGLNGTAKPGEDYEYVINYGNGKSASMTFNNGNFTYSIPINDLPNGASNYTVFAKALTKYYIDGNASNNGTITLTNPDWDFRKEPWSTEFQKWTKENDYYYMNKNETTVDGLNLYVSGDYNTRQIRGYVGKALYFLNTGSSENMNFTIYKDCKVTINGAEVAAGNRPVTIDNGGTTNIQSLSSKKIESNLELGSRTSSYVRIYLNNSGSGSPNFYEVKLTPKN